MIRRKMMKMKMEGKIKRTQKIKRRRQQGEKMKRKM